MIKLILKDKIESNRVCYRNNKSYLNMLLETSMTMINTANNYIQLNSKEKIIYKLNNVNEILLYKDKMLEVAK